MDRKRKRVGVILKEEYAKRGVKLEMEGVMMNVITGYASQVDCEIEEKEKFWSKLDEVVESIPMEKSCDGRRLQWPCWWRETELLKR